MANFKTNAMRILDKKKVNYEMYTYQADDGNIDGISVAAKIGYPEKQVYKTLVTQGKSGNYFVFVIPVDKELDLKKAARAVGEKTVEMIPVSQINKVTGYVRGGCSPIGMKKQFATIFDSSSERQEAILVSGGRIGLQIKAEPTAIANACEAIFAELTEGLFGL